MRHLLMCVEGGSARVQLVEDPLARGVLHRVACVDQGSGFVGADACCRLGDELVKVGFAAGPHREPNHEGEGGGVLSHLSLISSSEGLTWADPPYAIRILSTTHDH